MNVPQKIEKLPSDIEFKKNGVEVWPFLGPDGMKNFTGKYLGLVYRRIVREESVYKIFYDGSVKNTHDFKKFAQDKENELFFVKYKGRDAGFFWLNRFRQKTAFITYCLYKEFWGKDALAISKLCIEFIFERKNSFGEHLVDVILGLTPANNKLAIKFLLKNDMTIMGRLPGALRDAHENITVDGVFSYICRNNKPSIRIPKIYIV